MTVLPVTVIDDGVHALRFQVSPGGRGRSQMQRRERRSEPPVRLLGEGRVDVPGPQSGLEVDERDLVVEGRQPGGEGAGGVSLDHDDVRPVDGQQVTDPGECSGGDLGQPRAGAHQVEVVLRNDAEEAVDLVEHLPVLAGHGDDRFQPRTVCHGVQERRHLDGLRSGAVDGHDSSHVHLPQDARCTPIYRRAFPATAEIAERQRHSDARTVSARLPDAGPAPN